MSPKLYLASKSPRRNELLKYITTDYLIINSDVDESILLNESPNDYLNRIVRDKANSAWNDASRDLDIPCLVADTIVVINDTILCKPESSSDAHEMLQKLQDRTHFVYTMVGMIHGKKYESVLSSSEVTFKKLSHDQIDSYLKQNESMDKAGAYAVQGQGALFIKNISGSYSGVMGLPVYETNELLNLFNNEISWL